MFASWARPRGAAVGRLAVIMHGRPDLFPVNFLVDHGSIVFRTAARTMLDAAVDQAVPFEADGYEPDAGEAWGVVVKGLVREVEELDEVLAAELPLVPWHPSRKPRIIRIVPEDISGHSSITDQGSGRGTTFPIPSSSRPDAIVGIDAGTICGTDLHILSGQQRDRQSRGVGCGSRDLGLLPSHWPDRRLGDSNNDGRGAKMTRSGEVQVDEVTSRRVVTIQMTHDGSEEVGGIVTGSDVLRVLAGSDRGMPVGDRR